MRSPELSSARLICGSIYWKEWLRGWGACSYRWNSDAGFWASCLLPRVGGTKHWKTLLLVAFLYSEVCVCCMYIFMFMCAHMHVEPKSQLLGILHHISLLRQDLWTWDSPICLVWLINELLGIYLSLLLQHRSYGHIPPCLVYYVGIGDQTQVLPTFCFLPRTRNLI